MWSSSDQTAASYAAMVQDVHTFRLMLEEFLTHCVTFGPSPAGMWEVSRDGHEAEFDRLKSELSVLAGAAQSGILVTNSFVGSVDSSGQRAILNPIAAWLVITQPKAMLGRDDVLGACQLTEGRLRVMEREARAVERSFSGRVAALIGWPNKVRELAGLPKDSRAGKVTQWSLSALLVGVVTSILASGVVALAVLFWKSLNG